MFCMLLRKHCEGGTIEKVEQDGLERIIRLQVRQRDELGDISSKTLIMELMGRHSNLILTDTATGTILDGIHHVTPAISTYRIVMPGSAIPPPPEQHKANPLAIDRRSFEDLTKELPDPGAEDIPAAAAGLKAEQWIVQRFSGVSPLSAREIVHRSGHSAYALLEEIDSEVLWSAFHEVMQSVSRHEYKPVIIEQEGSGKSFFSVIELAHLQGSSVFFPFGERMPGGVLRGQSGERYREAAGVRPAPLSAEREKTRTSKSWKNCKKRCRTRRERINSAFWGSC